MIQHLARILIVDDEFSIRDSLNHWFRKDGYEVQMAADAMEAIGAMQSSDFDVVLLDVRLPGMDGMRLLEQIRRTAPTVIVIMITAYASVDTAVRALKLGAADYVTKPLNPEELSHVVAQALAQRRLHEENLQLRGTIDEMAGEQEIVGQSPPMQKVLELIEHVAKTEATVLILGESGTGKELVARAIHIASKRRYAPIVAVNCGGLPDSLLESELFGHEKGAFTGADEQRKGKIELADGGTLFLDEVGAINLKMQVDLLRVLETHEVFRLGTDRPRKVDFRVICATNDNLFKALQEGRVREDFYYRINVFTIELPPLRVRRTDIPALAQHFLDRFSRQMDSRITQISPQAMELLVNYDWPGNVRELSNAIERAMVVGRPPAILPGDLPVRRELHPAPPIQSLDDVEKQHIAAVLVSTSGNITRAAEILQVDRVTVYNKIKKYGLRARAGKGTEHQ
ncbi:MAG: sigma-54 dependent transcriptional regulator [Planctomycetota bacterium]